jgi:hypothetical protein
MRREYYIKVQKSHSWQPVFAQSKKKNKDPPQEEWSQLIHMLLTKSKTRNVIKHTHWNVPQLSIEQ